MLTHKKTIVAVAVVLSVSFGAYLMYSQRNDSMSRVVNPAAEPAKDAQVEIPKEPAAINSTEPTVEADGWKTYTSKKCGIPYRIPAEWSSDGWLSDGQIILVTPEAMLASSNFLKDHPDYVSEGEGGIRATSSIVIDCYPNISSLLETIQWPLNDGEVRDANTLSDVFLSKYFHSKDSSSTLTNTIVIDGQTAFEIMNDYDSDRKNAPYYTVYVEKSQIYAIQIRDTEYNKLSPTLKKIIASIKLK